MAARQGATTEWMIHPNSLNSFVFKSFVDESIVKQNFPQFSQTPHIVPEKIVESFVDQVSIYWFNISLHRLIIDDFLSS